MVTTLDTGIRNVRNVLRYTIGRGSIATVGPLLDSRRTSQGARVVWFLDEFFRSQDSTVKRLPLGPADDLYFVSTAVEPTTDYIDGLGEAVRASSTQPVAIVGMGGGATMDVAKAISNLLTNPGTAEAYQGWDLVRFPGIFKVAIPTLSGTGAETSRTCVMTNTRTGLKLGMNSDHTVYDQIVMDADLTATVPRNQYFYSGMDAYIHCMESLAGTYRNPIGDAFSWQTLELCRQVFLDSDMMADTNREKLMVASYLGGCAIATSYVGVVHPFSAGLSVVLGVHHCVANCIVMRAMEHFYPSGFKEFWSMVQRQEVDVPQGLCRELGSDSFDRLYEATIIHEKPLTNALGPEYRKILTRQRVEQIFRGM